MSQHLALDVALEHATDRMRAYETTLKESHDVTMQAIREMHRWREKCFALRQQVEAMGGEPVA